MNGGKATYFGVEVPFDLNTLLAFVSAGAAAGGGGEERAVEGRRGEGQWAMGGHGGSTHVESVAAPV